MIGTYRFLLFVGTNPLLFGTIPSILGDVRSDVFLFRMRPRLV